MVGVLLLRGLELWVMRRREYVVVGAFGITVLLGSVKLTSTSAVQYSFDMTGMTL